MTPLDHSTALYQNMIANTAVGLLFTAKAMTIILDKPELTKGSGWTGQRGQA